MKYVKPGQSNRRWSDDRRKTGGWADRFGKSAADLLRERFAARERRRRNPKANTSRQMLPMAASADLGPLGQLMLQYYGMSGGPSSGYSPGGGGGSSPPNCPNGFNKWSRRGRGNAPMNIADALGGAAQGFANAPSKFGGSGLGGFGGGGGGGFRSGGGFGGGGGFNGRRGGGLSMISPQGRQPWGLQKPKFPNVGMRTPPNAMSRGPVSIQPQVRNPMLRPYGAPNANRSFGSGPRAY